MKDNSKVPLTENPDHFMLRVGTNNLNSDREPKLIAKSIMDVNLSMEKENDYIIISNIIIRNDNLKEKATEIKGHLKLLCKERNIF